MTDAVGPVFTGGFEEFVVNSDSGEQYTILYLPDLNNSALQREGKAPVYYWVPGSVRLARFGDTGDFKFRHIHFVGVLDEDIHVGVEGRAEVVGGVLSFTTTSRYPTSDLQQAEQQLLNKFRGDDDRYWGWRTPVAPMFRIVPIKSNQTVITSLAPGRDGTAPAEGINPPGGGGAPGGGNGAPPGPRSMVRRADLNRRVVHGRNSNISNLDAWAWQLQGQGPGSVTGAENAYAGLIGQIPSELVWAGFQGGASPIVVAQNLMLPVWSQQIYLKITGEWDRIFQHFSAHANYRYMWFAADIKAEFNQLRINGGIKVEMHVDGTLPNAQQMEEMINKRIDLVVDKFMQQATLRIFEPAPPTVPPAQAPSGGIFSGLFGGGGGFAAKYRRDQTKLNLFYEETRYHRYLQPTTISSSFEGFYNVMKRDPDAAKKYFTRLVLGDLSRKVTRIVKPVVNWPDPAKNWVGEPVAFLSAEIGYPGPDGTPQWAAHVFQSTDTAAETNWNPAFALRQKDEVVNPPRGWEPDKAFMRRRVHLSEPLGATDNPYVKCDVEKNLVDLDPPGGVLSSDKIVEVRADSVGKLEVGPIEIDVVLQDATQVVSAEFKPLGKKHDGTERSVVKFEWKNNDQDQPRYWEIFTGQPDYASLYQYRVSVTVKGSLFSKGMSWTGPWVDGQGNGPLMVHVPLADEPGVTVRRMTPRELSLPSEAAVEEPVTGVTPPPTTVGAPPTGVAGARPDGGGAPGMPPTGERTAAERDEKTVAGYGVTAPRMPAPPGDEGMAEPATRGTRSVAERAEGDSPPTSNGARLEPLEEGWVQR
jgi:hypothetical protein